MIPLRDESRRPVRFSAVTITITITITIIAINVLVFLLELTGGDAFEDPRQLAELQGED